MREDQSPRTRRQELRRDATLPELLLWSRLRRKQIGFKFRRQESVGQYIADFMCAALKLIIEIDGPHHSLPEYVQHDKIRETYLRREGYHILHYTDQDIVKNLDNVVLDIWKHCEELSD